jgi:hypothetical protein
VPVFAEIYQLTSHYSFFIVNHFRQCDLESEETVLNSRGGFNTASKLVNLVETAVGFLMI